LDRFFLHLPTLKLVLNEDSLDCQIPIWSVTRAALYPVFVEFNNLTSLHNLDTKASVRRISFTKFL